MMAAQMTPEVLEQLPDIRGRYEFNVPMNGLTWFRVGGPADILFRPADEEDLIHFLKNRPDGVPLTVIGVGSNLLVRDGGIRGIVVRLGKGFSGSRIDGDILHTGGATPDVAVALAAQQAGLAGMEFLRGVPGTIGGAVRMNAGAYGAELTDVFAACVAVDLEGDLHRLGPDDIAFSYRHSSLPEDWIVTRVGLQGTPDDPDTIASRMTDISEARLESQPVKSRTGGSTFKNPSDRKAWELIDEAGCRGLQIGEAQVSKQHCNFLINLGNATASDLERLGEEVRRRVHDQSGVTLEWEIRILGEFSFAGTSGGGEQ